MAICDTADCYNSSVQDYTIAVTFRFIVLTVNEVLCPSLRCFMKVSCFTSDVTDNNNFESFSDSFDELQSA